MGSVHSSSNALYLPDPSEGKTLILNTETDRITGSIDGTGNNTIASICQDRNLVFLSGSQGNEAMVHRIGNCKNLMTMKFGFPPGRISMDSDRDVLLVSGDGYAFYTYPDAKKVDFPEIRGKAIDTRFDSLADSFTVLMKDPSRLVIINSGERLSISREIGFGEEAVTSAVLCTVEKKVVAGTEEGKILVSSMEKEVFTMAADFREPVKKMIFNPLVNHLYVIFRESRDLGIVDLQNDKVREVVKCSSEIGDIMFDDLHNKIYALLPTVPALEAYLDMGR